MAVEVEDPVGTNRPLAELAVPATVERDLGHATLRAVKKLLPFSRNDLWEIAELRQQLHRK